MNFGTIQVANIFVGTLNAIEAYFGTENVWGKSEPVTANWLCFTAEEANSTVHLDKAGSPNAISIETSRDGNTWTDYSWTDKTGDTLTLANVGDKVYMRAKNENQTIGSSTSNYYQFAMTGKIAASGNIQTLLKADGSRTDAPAYCYYRMFNGCTSLTTAPELPATTLANNCYDSMFYHCTSLTTASKLPATTLAVYCYRYMFQGCTSLTTAPELPATTLANFCYRSMFDGCRSLTTAPELPATTLATSCYYYMFSNCKSLTQAPELPATTLDSNCYLGMFIGCTNLNTIKLAYTGNFSTVYFNNWVTGVASTGTFYYNGSDTTTGESAIPAGWTVVKDSQEPSALCFTAQEANSTVAMKKNSQAPEVSLEYSTDGNTWSPFVVGTTTVTLANIGDKMYMRATSAGNTGMGSSTSNYNQFVMTGKISASGNVDTLLDQNGNATLTRYCYYFLFNGCTSLTTAPELPATTLADLCYSFMFRGCTSLTTAPELPATTLATSCYYYMFEGCTSLTSAPELPATTLADNCYRSMFQNCTSLTTAPELPATTLADECYKYIFNGCTSLTTAPELPATTLYNSCYWGMFFGCTSLTTAPELPATFANGCYQEMFYNCTNLNTIKLGYTGNFSTLYFNNWVKGVASTGTFYYNGSDTTTGTSAIPEGWTVVKPSQEISALCFTAEEANSTVHLDKFGTPNAISLETSTDGNTWTDYSWSGNTGTTLTLTNVGDKVYMRAKNDNQTIGSTDENYYKFSMSGKIATSGNIQTLLKADGSRTDAPAHCYYYMFNGCSSLTTAPELPATTLDASCYSHMFQGCTSLTSAPELPATTLANECYSSMFNGCTALTQAPELPAMTLFYYCYTNMFLGCTSLTTAPILPATTLASNCYDSMFQDCTSLTTSPTLPATTLANFCYNWMFNGCTALTQAPELPATKLAIGCYSYMFSNCSKLNTITLGYTGNFADAPNNAFINWVSGVASTGTFYYNGSDTTTGDSAIPTGWTVTPYTS